MKTLPLPQVVAGLTCCAALFALPGSARAQIFLYSQSGPSSSFGTVGSYNFDGSAINSSLITGLTFNPYIINNLAVSGTALYVYNPGSTGYYSEYSTSGATVNANFTGNVGWASGATVNGGNLYVAGYIANTVGSYNATSGATINASLISSGLNQPYGPVVSGGHIYVTNAGNGTVGEFNLDGSVVNTALITGLTQPSDLAVANGDLYVSSFGTGNHGKVGEYDATTGAAVNANLVTGLGGSELEIAVAGNDLYVLQGTLSKFDATSGALINSSLITGLPGTEGIAILGTPEPGTLALAGLGGLSLLLARRRQA